MSALSVLADCTEAPAWNGGAVQSAPAPPAVSPGPAPTPVAAPQIDLKPPRVELNQPMAIDCQAPAEPGTAQFEGTIETLPVMTTDDRPRRDLYQGNQ